MTWFDDETAIRVTGDHAWSCHLDRHWNIGETPNGGYALMPVLRALGELAGHPDPLTVTAHFLRPALPDRDGVVEGRTVRRGRTIGTATASLVQDGSERLVAMAAFGVFGDSDDRSELDLSPPADIAPPDECFGASDLEEGIDLAIASRVEVRLDPGCAVPGASALARVDGWARLADGSAPSALALPLFADAFPPSIYPKLGRVGWVPTIELTVQVRRAPAPGWIRGSFVCDDVADGRLIETGTLWDESGRIVARSRQLAMLLADPT